MESGDINSPGRKHREITIMTADSGATSTPMKWKIVASEEGAAYGAAILAGAGAGAWIVPSNKKHSDEVVRVRVASRIAQIGPRQKTMKRGYRKFRRSIWHFNGLK